MKKIIILLFVVALSQLGYSQKQTLELNLKTGETYSQSYTANSNIVQNINGMEMNIKMDIGGKMSFKVLGQSDKSYDLEAQYTRMTMNMALPNGNMEYDTDKKDTTDVMAKVLGGLINKPFTLKMTKSGKISEISGVENLFSGSINDMGDMNDMQKKQVLEQVMQSYGDKAFKGNLEMGTAIFPETKVSTGDSWTVSTMMESSMKANIETVYTLKEVGSDYYLIDGKSEVKPIESENTMTMNGMELNYEISGTMTSTLKIDKSSCWISEGDIRQEMDMTMKIQDNPQVPGGMTIPMQIDTQMKITK